MFSQIVSETAVRTLALLFSLATVSVPWEAEYPRVAEAIAEAAEANPFKGTDAWETAAIMTVWAQKESRFNPAVIGDHGASVGLMQVNPAYAARFLHRPVQEVREDLLDPQKATVIWLALAHESMRMCRRRPMPERLAQLAWGPDCDHRRDLSRARMMRGHDYSQQF